MSCDLSILAFTLEMVATILNSLLFKGSATRSVWDKFFNSKSVPDRCSQVSNVRHFTLLMPWLRHPFASIAVDWIPSSVATAFKSGWKTIDCLLTNSPSVLSFTSNFLGKGM